ncbi:MAG: MBL fold metallo-hydrolase [Candidatus Lokiarchaeota archaeon]|nr:MBL fold metallo-hydrolase [Candidatus Lokiarchaeota archaeon]
MIKISISIQWLAHAAFKIKTNEKVIYIDPRYMKKFDNYIGSYFKNPEQADIILFTHHHTDHCYPSSISKMSNSKTIFIGPERCHERIGNKLRIIQVNEVIKINKIQIKAVHAYNIKRCRKNGGLFHPKGLRVGYLINIKGFTIYHAGDTEKIPEMDKFGKVDIAMIPIGDKFTMSIYEAIKATITIQPKIVIPMHNHESKPEEFKIKLETNTNISVKALEKGESFVFP